MSDPLFTLDECFQREFPDDHDMLSCPRLILCEFKALARQHNLMKIDEHGEPMFALTSPLVPLVFTPEAKRSILETRIGDLQNDRDNRRKLKRGYVHERDELSKRIQSIVDQEPVASAEIARLLAMATNL
jgi:hypothetical protein